VDVHGGEAVFFWPPDVRQLAAGGLRLWGRELRQGLGLSPSDLLQLVAKTTKTTKTTTKTAIWGAWWSWGASFPNFTLHASLLSLF